MLDVIGPRAELIDGNEPAYYCYLPNAQEFDAFKDFKNAARDFVTPQNRAEYKTQVKTSQAVFVDGLLGLHKADNAGRLLGCHLRDVIQRQLALEHHTYHALETTNEYVRVYNEQINWWGTPSPKLPLPNQLGSSSREDRHGSRAVSVEDFLSLAAQRYARTRNDEPNLSCLP